MIGTSLSHYRIVSKIGAGGMGEVFLAEDLSLGRQVALKFLPAEMQQDELAHRRFLREARLAAALNHPNICSIYEVGEAEGKDFIVMEYVEGRTLKAALGSRLSALGAKPPAGGLPIDEAVRIGLQLAEALEEAHGRGIVHRDLKPANIMLGPRGHVKVMDFGLAKLVKDAEKALSEEDTLTVLTKAGSTLGTLAYMSPEQLRGEAVDARSDVFSFGIVLYEMLAGVHPFRESSPMDIAAGILNKEPAPLSAHVATCPPLLQETLSRMLAKRASERGLGIDAVKSALNALIKQLEQPDVRPSLLAALRRPAVWVPALVVLAAMAAGGVWTVNRWQHQRWVREVALPELRQLAEAGGLGQGAETVAAYRAAVALEKDLAGDPEFARIMSQMSIETSIETTPPGATVYAKSYEEPEAPWELLGTTPVSKRRVPLAPLRFKAEKPGYETLYRAAMPFKPRGQVPSPGTIAWSLDPEGTTPEGMTWVDTSNEAPRTVPSALPRFLIDRHEVTNRQFKAFVDAWGYGDRRYWKVAFVKGGRLIEWDTAMRDFVDRTGRPGPSTWEGGTYPAGQEEFPVTGVSWYEAAAYAAFAGKQLPTVAHWEAAASRGHPMQAAMVSRSNFSGKGPVKVGSAPNSGEFDVFDLAGNAREWCWNEHASGRAIRGGVWDDHVYMFVLLNAMPAFDRSARNGFRCMRQAEGAPAPAKVFEPVPRSAVVRDYSKETPVGDAVFAAYRQMFSYDPLPLEARTEARVEGAEWTRERVSFTAAYGGERVIAQVFLPRGAKPPYQVVVYFPGSAAAMMAGPSDSVEKGVEFFNNVEFLIRNGRAVVYPVYQGTHERRGSPTPFFQYCGTETQKFSSYQRQVIQDLRRTIDYLETRSDMDSSRIAFDGWSWGGYVAPLALGVETRFKAAIVIAGGLQSNCRSLPDADGLNFAPRVKTPALMLHGRYDITVPWETDGKPLYEHLGTPAPDKVLKMYDTDHFIPRTELMKESLAWLDKYLGPVKR